jgi:hypothetical protein
MYTTCYGLLTPSTGCLHSYFYSSIVVNIRNYSVLRRNLDKSKVNIIEVFSHGQLYTAISRIRTRRDGLVVVASEDQADTKNVVYAEMLS